jgi:cephalosporin hydroxylase
MGIPIIQFPADIVVTQEIIWKIKPTIIIETGVARGGSLIFNASQLALLDLCDNDQSTIDKNPRRCIGVDIEIRNHNRAAIEDHPLAKYITLIEGSSIDLVTLNQVKSMITPKDKVMVILDSNHTFQHVMEELNMYASLVSSESYLIVHDTGIENAPESLFKNREWGVGNNPLTAVKNFLDGNTNFLIDEIISDKLLITSSPKGYLKRT